MESADAAALNPGPPARASGLGTQPAAREAVAEATAPEARSRGAAGGSERESRVSLPAGRRHARGPPGKGSLGPVLGTSSGKGRPAFPRRRASSPAKPSDCGAEPGHPERRGAAWRRPRPLGRPRLLGRKTPAPDPTPPHWTAPGWDAGTWML